MPLQILKTIQDKKNPLLKRRELRLLVQQDSVTPSKAEIEKMLAEIEKVDQNKISVEHIYQRYGKTISEIIANVYDEPVAKKEKKAKGEVTEEKAPEKKEEK